MAIRINTTYVSQKNTALTLGVRYCGRVEYRAMWDAQRQHTRQRDPKGGNELWLLEHHSVFTLGCAARRDALLDTGDIPVIHSDRGGQVTHHGPGQLLVYMLLNLDHIELGIRGVVAHAEQVVVDLLACYGLQAKRRHKAPGVYVNHRKIASLGMRVRQRCTYHGLAINVAMDLSPFRRIHPCGDPNLEVTDLASEGVCCTLEGVAESVSAMLAAKLGFATPAAKLLFKDLSNDTLAMAP